MGRSQERELSSSGSGLASRGAKSGERPGNRHKRNQKQRARDIKRLLKRDNIPATVRQTQERVLALLETEVKDEQDNRKVKKLAKKYKMVRFFDRRKLTRKLKKVNRQISVCKDESERATLSEQLDVLRKEYNYVTHFPADKKYVSVHPVGGCLNESSRRQMADVQADIHSLVASGKLPDASLDVVSIGGKSVAGARTSTRQKQKLTRVSKPKYIEKTDGNGMGDDIYFIDTSRDDFFL
ncbi:uncharacterized protein LOC134191833 [Corticium candelabrum]|uniref:uncharacterized protein LOC134191833 n=1 Tax=Corticium candelabrum TaxID=121492 RepID=UPI002E2560FF|nr:uncharacterized protein LOC134191833 [Corticium candelabrum]